MTTSSQICFTSAGPCPSQPTEARTAPGHRLIRGAQPDGDTGRAAGGQPAWRQAHGRPLTWEAAEGDGGGAQGLGSSRPGCKARPYP